MYAFFGFGEQIRKWLATIGTNRNAQIILGDENLSAPFSLEKGHAQDDSPSPFLYNMAAQICIWKIELDPNFKSVYGLQHQQRVQEAAADLPVPVNSGRIFEFESARETNKNESFADDANNFTILELGSLTVLKNILSDFSILSGLRCNVEKTCVMRIGDLSGELDPDILGLGFAFVDQLTLLGFKLSATEDLAEINYVDTVGKISNIIRFWERFNLSLPGKISIYKCLILSQLSYRAAILTPAPATLSLINDMIERFVLKGFSFAKDRIYLESASGGLGMIPLNKYIQGLQCAWVKRAFDCTNDNWKYDIHLAGFGRIVNVSRTNANIELGTVLSNIIDSYCTFVHKFTEYGNNYMKVPILYNTHFRYGRDRNLIIDDNFIGRMILTTQPELIRTLTWEKCTHNGHFVHVRHFNNHTGINFTREQYYDLKLAYIIAKRKFHKEGGFAMTLEDFMSTFKKGSKKFRRILSFDTKPYNIENLTQAATYARITDTTKPNRNRVLSMYSTWSIHCLPNRLRTFILKYYNNILGLANRIAHFVPNTDTSCTFCLLSQVRPVPEESFSHVFFDCPHSSRIVELFFARYITIEFNREQYFTGLVEPDNERINRPFAICMDVLRYYIWQCKLNKKLPTFSAVCAETEFMIGYIRRSSKKISDLFENCPLFRRDHGGG